MSECVSADAVRSEWCVVSRGQWSSTFHRPDPDADDVRPACTQATADRRGEYRRVGVATIASHYEPCMNPACWGDPDPGQTHICVGPLSDRPLRVRAIQVAIGAALLGGTPIDRSGVADLLGVEVSRDSVWRGLADARDAGWLIYDESTREYRAGPLADAVRSDQA